jgi:hypothetical protein
MVAAVLLRYKKGAIDIEFGHILYVVEIEIEAGSHVQYSTLGFFQISLMLSSNLGLRED